MKILYKMIAIGAAFGLGSAASAELFQIDMSGETEHDEIFGTGATFTASLIYSTDVGTFKDLGAAGADHNFDFSGNVQSMSFHSGSVNALSDLSNSPPGNIFIVTRPSGYTDLVHFYSGPHTDQEFDIEYPNGTLDGSSIPASLDASSNVHFIFYQGLANGGGSYLGGVTKISLTDLGPSSSAVPEPASWVMMVGGFGLIGAAARRKKAAVRFA